MDSDQAGRNTDTNTPKRAPGLDGVRALAAMAIMRVGVAAAATVIEPDQGDSLRLALLAAVTYTSNWYQILHHVSYFASAGQAAAPPPLDHLWSLAIEEQF